MNLIRKTVLEHGVTGLARFFEELLLDVVQPSRKLKFLRGLIFANYDYVARFPKVEICDFLEVYPAATDLEVMMSFHRDSRWSLSDLETLYLVALVTIINTPKIFEIGSAHGETSYALARSNSEAHIFSLDLPVQDTVAHQAKMRWKNTPQEKQVTQLYGDSTNFDYNCYFGQMDLVLIDGEHSYLTCKSDSANALKLIHDKGIIIWDDYQALEVQRAVNELLPKENIFSLKGTGFAVLDHRLTELPQEIGQ
jgi:hypothetical protein